jgi:SnoaL-like polyketide cyclase
MSSIASSESAKATVRRNTEEVQGRGNFEVFEELFADDFIDHTPQPGTTPDKTGVRKLYTYQGPFLGVAPTHRKIHFEAVDVMRVQNGKITDHWGVGNLLSLMQQIGGWNPPSETDL